MNQFKNPYAVPFQSFDGPDKNLYRAPASIGKSDYEFIRGIRPTSGTVNTTQNLLWSKLVTALKHYGITDISKQSDFESFVANCTITDGRDGVQRSTPRGNGAETAERNDGAGTPGTCAKDTKPKNRKSNAPRGNGEQNKTGPNGK